MPVPSPSLHDTLDAYEPMLLAWLRQGLDEHDIVALTDEQGAIRYVNERFCEISGYTAEELLGQNHRILKSGQHPASFYAKLWETIVEGEIWRGAICNRDKSGRLYWVQTTILPLLGLAGRRLGYLSIRTDVTRLVLAERELALKTRELQLLFDHSPIGLSWREFDASGAPGPTTSTSASANSSALAARRRAIWPTSNASRIPKTGLAKPSSTPRSTPANATPSPSRSATCVLTD